MNSLLAGAILGGIIFLVIRGSRTVSLTREHGLEVIGEIEVPKLTRKGVTDVTNDSMPSVDSNLLPTGGGGGF